MIAFPNANTNANANTKKMAIKLNTYRHLE